MRKKPIRVARWLQPSYSLRPLVQQLRPSAVIKALSPDNQKMTAL